MIVKLDDGRELDVIWAYGPCQWRDGSFRFTSNQVLDAAALGGLTTCCVKDITKGQAWAERVGIGIAECSPDDMFCRRTGRKLSLTRALKAAKLDMDARRQVWQNYLALSPKNRVGYPRCPRHSTTATLVNRA